jgi:predicted nucleotidyltransferase
MFLDNYYNNLTNLCKQYNVKTLYAFGSVLTDRFGAGSDVDLIVDFEDMPVENYADNYFDFKFSLEDMLHRPIDLLEEKAIHNPYFKRRINPQKQLIYG